MKKKSLLLTMKTGRCSLLLPLVLAVVGCELIGEFLGSLNERELGVIRVNIAAQMGEKTIQPTLDMSIASYEITLSGPGGPVSDMVPVAENSATFLSLEPGEWTVTVNAKNDDDPAMIIATDSETATVEGGQTAVVDITVVPVVGEGTLQISLSWPDGVVASPALQAVLTPVEGAAADISALFVIDTTGTPDSASYSGSWSTGYYTLSLDLLDGGTTAWRREHAVRIVEGQTSVGDYLLSETAFRQTATIQVNLASEMNNPYTISFTGVQADITPSEDMTVELSLDPTDTLDSIRWYLNGTLLAETGSSITIGPSGVIVSEGSYWLDVMVGKGTMVSSKGAEFTVSLPPPVGTQKWAFTAGGRLVSSPAIGVDGTIYVGSYDGNLYAVNPDGTQRWVFATGDLVFSSPAIGADGTIYVGSFDNNVYAINPDGTQKWAFATGFLVRSSPAIGADGTIYVGSFDDNLYAINPDGTQKWSFDTGWYIYFSAAIGADGTVYVGSDGGILYAINADGTEKWSFATGNSIYSAPVFGTDGTIYVGSRDYNLYAINPDGTEKWCFATGNNVESSPAIGADGTVYLGAQDNKVYAINPDGSQKWTFTIGGWVYSSPAIGADGTVYLGSDDGTLYAINPNGTQKWTFATGGRIDSGAAIGADGTIYIGSKDTKLYAISGDSGGLADTPWPMFHQNPQHTGRQADGG